MVRNLIKTAEGISSSAKKARKSEKNPILDCFEKTWYPLRNLYNNIKPINKRASLNVRLEEVVSEKAITNEENNSNKPTNLLFKKTTKR